MKKIGEPLYFDALGLEKLTKEILLSQEKLDEIVKKKGEILKSGVRNNGFETSTEYQLVEIEYNNELAKLKSLLDMRKRVVLVERHNEENLADIGDILLVNVKYSEDDIEDTLIKLVGGRGNVYASPAEISINSPLGQAIYKKTVGSVNAYTVEGNEFYATISQKLNLVQEDSAPSRK